MLLKKDHGLPELAKVFSNPSVNGTEASGNIQNHWSFATWLFRSCRVTKGIMRIIRMTCLLPALLFWLVAGCAHSDPLASKLNSTPPDLLPICLLGSNCEVQLDFNAHPAVTVPYQLADDELCYLPIGDGILVCAQNGSYLLFGPGEGVPVVRDNPVYRLSPAGHDPGGLETIQTFGTVMLIAASADRLPDALAAYLDDPGPHRRIALTLAGKILSKNGANFGAAARGGTFAVSIRLTSAGREILTEALLTDTNETGIYRIGNKTSKRGDQRFNNHGHSAAKPWRFGPGIFPPGESRFLTILIKEQRR